MLRLVGATPHLVQALIATSLAVVACGDRKEPAAEDPAPPSPTAAEQDKTRPETHDAEPAARPDTELLGLWKVVEASGNFADINIGLKWEFLAGGRAIAHSLRVDPDRKARVTAAEDPPDAGVPVQSPWSWKQVGPNRIEMKHPDSPRIAPIKYVIEGDIMHFDWLSGSQKFVMKRQETGK